MYNRNADDLPGIPERSFRPWDYILGMGSDLKLTLIFVVAMAAFMFIPALSVTIIRPFLGVFMILFVPGYAFIAMLFPGRSNISGLERTFLSFTFSVVAAALIGFALNYTPVGIRLESVVACLSMFVLVCVLIANKRRSELPEDERFFADVALIYGSVKGLISPGAYQDGGGFTNKALNAVIMIVLLLSIGVITYAVVLPRQGETFTEFYLLGPDGKAVNYPANIVLGNESQVVVGTTNHEHRTVTYDLVASLNGTEQDKWLKTDRFILADNETIEKKMSMMLNTTGTNMKLQFLLFTDGDFSSPYRELHIWVNVTAPPNATTRTNTTVPLNVYFP